MSSQKSQSPIFKKNSNLLLKNKPIYEDHRYKEFEGILTNANKENRNIQIVFK